MALAPQSAQAATPYDNSICDNLAKERHADHIGEGYTIVLFFKDLAAQNATPEKELATYTDAQSGSKWKLTNSSGKSVIAVDDGAYDLYSSMPGCISLGEPAGTADPFFVDGETYTIRNISAPDGYETGIGALAWNSMTRMGEEDNGSLDADTTPGVITLAYPSIAAYSVERVKMKSPSVSYIQIKDDDSDNSIAFSVGIYGGKVDNGDTFTVKLASGRILYDGNGNTNTVENTQTLEQNGTATEAIAAAQNTLFTRDGYKFSGWNTSADGTGDAIKPGEEITYAKGDTTLYAQWEVVPAAVVTSPATPTTPTASAEPESTAKATLTPEPAPALAKTGTSTTALVAVMALLGISGSALLLRRKMSETK